MTIQRQNDSWHNDIQHNDTRYSYGECHFAECLYAKYHYSECRYAECQMLSVVAPIQSTGDQKLRLALINLMKRGLGCRRLHYFDLNKPMANINKK